MGISSDSYRHQTTNDFERLLDKEGAENTSTITTPILINIYMHIGPTGFLEDGAPEVVFGTDRKIREGLVIVR